MVLQQFWVIKMSWTWLDYLDAQNFRKFGDPFQQDAQSVQCIKSISHWHFLRGNVSAFQTPTAKQCTNMAVIPFHQISWRSLKTLCKDLSALGNYMYVAPTLSETENIRKSSGFPQRLVLRRSPQADTFNQVEMGHMGNHNGIPRICWLIFVATKTEVFTRTGSGSTGKKMWQSKHWLSRNIYI